MSDLSPRSPLYISSGSNGSSDIVHDNVPLLMLMPNLQTQLCWMESNLTILLNPLNPLGQPFLMLLNIDWDAMVVVSTQQLSQNLVFNLDLTNIQGSF